MSESRGKKTPAQSRAILNEIAQATKQLAEKTRLRDAAFIQNHVAEFHLYNDECKQLTTRIRALKSGGTISEDKTASVSSSVNVRAQSRPAKPKAPPVAPNPIDIDEKKADIGIRPESSAIPLPPKDSSQYINIIQKIMAALAEIQQSKTTGKAISLTEYADLVSQIKSLDVSQDPILEDFQNAYLHAAKVATPAQSTRVTEEDIDVDTELDLADADETTRLLNEARTEKDRQELAQAEEELKLDEQDTREIEREFEELEATNIIEDTISAILDDMQNRGQFPAAKTVNKQNQPIKVAENYRQAIREELKSALDLLTPQYLSSVAEILSQKQFNQYQAGRHIRDLFMFEMTDAVNNKTNPKTPPEFYQKINTILEKNAAELAKEAKEAKDMVTSAINDTITLIAGRKELPLEEKQSDSRKIDEAYKNFANHVRTAFLSLDGEELVQHVLAVPIMPTEEFHISTPDPVLFNRPKQKAVTQQPEKKEESPYQSKATLISALQKLYDAPPEMLKIAKQTLKLNIDSPAFQQFSTAIANLKKNNAIAAESERVRIRDGQANAIVNSALDEAIRTLTNNMKLPNNVEMKRDAIVYHRTDFSKDLETAFNEIRNDLVTIIKKELDLGGSRYSDPYTVAQELINLYNGTPTLYNGKPTPLSSPEIIKAFKAAVIPIYIHNSAKTISADLISQYPFLKAVFNPPSYPSGFIDLLKLIPNHKNLQVAFNDAFKNENGSPSFNYLQNKLLSEQLNPNDPLPSQKVTSSIEDFFVKLARTAQLEHEKMIQKHDISLSISREATQSEQKIDRENLVSAIIAKVIKAMSYDGSHPHGDLAIHLAEKYNRQQFHSELKAAFDIIKPAVIKHMGEDEDLTPPYDSPDSLEKNLNLLFQSNRQDILDNLIAFRLPSAEIAEQFADAIVAIKRNNDILVEKAVQELGNELKRVYPFLQITLDKPANHQGLVDLVKLIPKQKDLFTAFYNVFDNFFKSSDARNDDDDRLEFSPRSLLQNLVLNHIPGIGQQKFRNSPADKRAPIEQLIKDLSRNIYGLIEDRVEYERNVDEKAPVSRFDSYRLNAIARQKVDLIIGLVLQETFSFKKPPSAFPAVIPEANENQIIVTETYRENFRKDLETALKVLRTDLIKEVATNPNLSTDQNLRDYLFAVTRVAVNPDFRFSIKVKADAVVYRVSNDTAEKFNEKIQLILANNTNEIVNQLSSQFSPSLRRALAGNEGGLVDLVRLFPRLTVNQLQQALLEVLNPPRNVNNDGDRLKDNLINRLTDIAGTQPQRNADLISIENLAEALADFNKEQIKLLAKQKVSNAILETVDRLARAKQLPSTQRLDDSIKPGEKISDLYEEKDFKNHLSDAFALLNRDELLVNAAIAEQEQVESHYYTTHSLSQKLERLYNVNPDFIDREASELKDQLHLNIAEKDFIQFRSYITESIKKNNAEAIIKEISNTLPIYQILKDNKAGLIELIELSEYITAQKLNDAFKIIFDDQDIRKYNTADALRSALINELGMRRLTPDNLNKPRINILIARLVEFVEKKAKNIVNAALTKVVGNITAKQNLPPEAKRADNYKVYDGYKNTFRHDVEKAFHIFESKLYEEVVTQPEDKGSPYSSAENLAIELEKLFDSTPSELKFSDDKMNNFRSSLNEINSHNAEKIADALIPQLLNQYRFIAAALNPAGRLGLIDLAKKAPDITRLENAFSTIFNNPRYENNDPGQLRRNLIVGGLQFTNLDIVTPNITALTDQLAQANAAQVRHNATTVVDAALSAIVPTPAPGNIAPADKARYVGLKNAFSVQCHDRRKQAQIDALRLELINAVEAHPHISRQQVITAIQTTLDVYTDDLAHPNTKLYLDSPAALQNIKDSLNATFGPNVGSVADKILELNQGAKAQAYFEPIIQELFTTLQNSPDSQQYRYKLEDLQHYFNTPGGIKGLVELYNGPAIQKDVVRGGAVRTEAEQKAALVALLKDLLIPPIGADALHRATNHPNRGAEEEAHLDKVKDKIHALAPADVVDKELYGHLSFLGTCIRAIGKKERARIVHTTSKLTELLSFDKVDLDKLEPLIKENHTRVFHARANKLDRDHVNLTKQIWNTYYKELSQVKPILEQRLKDLQQKHDEQLARHPYHPRRLFDSDLTREITRVAGCISKLDDIQRFVEQIANDPLLRAGLNPTEGVRAIVAKKGEDISAFLNKNAIAQAANSYNQVPPHAVTSGQDCLTKSIQYGEVRWNVYTDLTPPAVGAAPQPPLQAVFSEQFDSVTRQPISVLHWDSRRDLLNLLVQAANGYLKYLPQPNNPADTVKFFEGYLKELGEHAGTHTGIINAETLESYLKNPPHDLMAGKLPADFTSYTSYSAEKVAKKIVQAYVNSTQESYHVLYQFPSFDLIKIARAAISSYAANTGNTPFISEEVSCDPQYRRAFAFVATVLGKTLPAKFNTSQRELEAFVDYCNAKSGLPGYFTKDFIRKKYLSAETLSKETITTVRKLMHK